MKTIQHLALIACCCMLGTTSLTAQTGTTAREYGAVRPAEDFTDEEIENFGRTMKAVEDFQQSSQAELERAVKAEGLTMDGYNAIAERIRLRDKENAPNEAETAKFVRINEVMHNNQREVGAKVLEAIEANGMDVRDYQDKFKAYQEDEAFRKRVQTKMKQ